MADEVEGKSDALIEERWAEMNAAWDAEIAIEEERDLLRVEVAQLRGMTESAIRALLQKFAHRLNLIDLAEVTEYLAAHEYGLALEEITQGLLEPPTDDDDVNRVIKENAGVPEKLMTRAVPSGWQPASTMPRDRWVVVYGAVVGGREGMAVACKADPNGGWIYDREITTLWSATHWMEVPK